MKLYVDSRCTSPYAMSVFVTLVEKDIRFEIATIDVDHGAQFELPYAATSLTQRVPTLVHDDFALSESSAITEYLEETFPATAVYPQDRRLRARARQVQAWLRSDLLPLRAERSTDAVFFGRKFPPLSAAASIAARKLFYAAESMLPDGADNLFGNWSIADTDLALMLMRLVMHGDTVPTGLEAYARRQWARPSVQQWVTRSARSEDSIKSRF